MKTLLTITVLMMSFASASVFAEGSKIKKSTIINEADTKNSMALAIKNSKANVGSISISNSDIKKSTIINEADTKNSMALAIKNSTANVGSINID